MDALRYGLGLKISDKYLWNELKSSDFPKPIDKLSLPCYFVTGKYDYLTPAKSAKAFLDSIKAPKKEFIVFENSAHYPQFEEKHRFTELIRRIYIDN